MVDCVSQLTAAPGNARPDSSDGYVEYFGDLGVVELGQVAVLGLAALVIGWSVLIMIYNLAFSQRRHPVADPNPWSSWQMSRSTTAARNSGARPARA